MVSRMLGNQLSQTIGLLHARSCMLVLATANICLFCTNPNETLKEKCLTICLEFVDIGVVAMQFQNWKCCVLCAQK
jgi:hypothetical protein